MYCLLLLGCESLAIYIKKLSKSTLAFYFANKEINLYLALKKKEVSQRSCLLELCQLYYRF